MKKYIISIVLILISTVITITSVEFILKFYKLDEHTLYYSSNHYGYNKKPNQKIIRNNSKISTDNLGNRNPIQNTIENTNLFFLGDSVTFGGSAVNDNETFSDILAKRLNKNYLNISNNGWGIPNIINFIDSHNLYKANSTYILVCIIDCFTRNLRRFEQYFFFSENYKFGIINYLKFLTYKVTELFRGSDTNFDLKRSKNETLSGKVLETHDNINTIKLSVKLLKEFKDKIELNNSKLIFLYSPNTNYIKSTISKNFDIEDYPRVELFKSLANFNIDYVNILEKLNEKEFNLFGRFFIDKVHLSKEGHQLYADILEKKINE
jgi:lysophospholipase L1-like esterase